MDVPRGAKRLLDVVGGLAALLLAIPIMLAAATWIRSVSPGPALFRQTRLGLRGSRFTMYKLRTMHCDAGAALADHLAASPAAADEWARYGRLTADPRFIRGARILRGFSIDELPQFWNVVVGDMSLVGPRPLELSVVGALPVDLLEMRHQVRPGITGLWQVSGRSTLDLVTLLKIDAAYVRTWSLRADLAILARTPGAVLSRRGAY